MRIGIYGYGGVGAALCGALRDYPDISAVGVFTERKNQVVDGGCPLPVYEKARLFDFSDQVDLVVNCGSSHGDLRSSTPEIAARFNVVDSFDIHQSVGAHYARCNSVAKAAGRVAVIGAGWDPGLFSVARCLFDSVAPGGGDYTFWGRGVSRGHSSAVRSIKGVTDAIQYTIPISSVLASARSGMSKALAPHEMHQRLVFVSCADGADREVIEREIRNMPGYFLGYETKVVFLPESEIEKMHSDAAHRGEVIKNTDGAKLSLRLALSSNPAFTAAMLLASARGAMELFKRELFGCFTLPEIPPAYLLPNGVSVFSYF